MLLRFNVLNPEDMQQVDGIDYPILINIDQIVTIKPITIMYQGNIINGFWVRTINGKKYKATRIPKSLEQVLQNNIELTEVKLNQNAQTEKQEPFFN
ncbi:MAG: hypothetical protein HN576_06240 [Bacteriovoracaceae bacterium]|jgi:hypothetical protein|nr:hypothetical protein [Bacteriovoracaceae bacterium]